VWISEQTAIISLYKIYAWEREDCHGNMCIGEGGLPWEYVHRGGRIAMGKCA